MYRRVIKRALDVFASALLLIILSPLFLLISLAIRIDSKGKILFRQERIGLHEEMFIAGKFGTVGVNKKRCLEFA